MTSSFSTFCLQNVKFVLQVVVKPTHKTVEGQILNGRAAEVAGCEDVSSSDDDENVHPRFSRPDHVKLLLQSKSV